MKIVRRVGPSPVALESTLLVHGVPRADGAGLAARLEEIVRGEGASPAFVGVVAGMGVVGLSKEELTTLLGAGEVPKANTSNLGVLMHRGGNAATTVSATMELAAAAGVRVFATGGLGGLHYGLGEGLERPDVSSDLAALARFPVAVVTSGVKGILNVEGTRELLESLGVCVVGFRTDSFPAFYRRESGAGVDARFDDVAELATFVRSELVRSGRGIVIANPIAAVDEIAWEDWEAWLKEARARVGEVDGRDATPALLAGLHEVSGGATLRANLALACENARLGARLAVAMEAG